MGDWIHKERTWSTSQEMSFDTPKIELSGFDIGFIEWLDNQCKGGWEICIHEIIEKKAQYSPTKEAHWCVFRKKIE